MRFLETKKSAQKNKVFDIITDGFVESDLEIANKKGFAEKHFLQTLAFYGRREQT